MRIRLLLTHKKMGRIINSRPLIRFISFCSLFFLLQSCQQEEKKTVKAVLHYEQFKDSVMHSNKDTVNEPTNIFDDLVFTPGADSLKTMLIRMDTMWRREAALMEQLDTMKKGFKNVPGYTEEEKAIIKENIRIVESFLLAKDTGTVPTCTEKECLLYAEIDKSKQKLYLYLLGELKDSFLVSTGKGKKYETPAMSRHPSGPVLVKYTSRKFPGGNYKGMGNMPYAVFIKGGYAIHGTTPGNFSKLGSKASHGCIRLHPDNAKIFNALVKTVGLGQTWVSIKDSIPKTDPDK
ncbi:MAG: L,D-transpeptidase [Chitinophagaceae bacterium]